MAITVIRYSERPELWADTDAVSQAVWPEYNSHGEVLGRYWGGQNDQDPEDPNPWRRRPPITMEEANRLAQLPTIAFVVIDEYTSADVDFEGHRFTATAIRGRPTD